MSNSLITTQRPVGGHIIRVYPRSSREVTGLFAVYGNVVQRNGDHSKYRLLPGCFDKSIAEDFEDLLFLWNHKSDILPTATILDIQEIGQDALPVRVRQKHPDASGGMLVTRRYLRNPQAIWVYEAIRAGVPLQMSYAHRPVWWEEDEIVSDRIEGVVKQPKELRLVEISDVPQGANLATRAALPGFANTGMVLEGISYRRIGAARPQLLEPAEAHSASGVDDTTHEHAEEKPK